MLNAIQFRFGSIEFWIIIIVIVVIFFLVPILFGAPWYPTNMNTVHKMLSMAAVQSGDVVYDLGSGDGRVIIMAAQEFNARSVGIEVNPFWVAWTRWRIRRLNLRGQVDVVWGNFFQTDLSEADVVTLYLLQLTNDRLQRKLETELQPEVRVVSRTFTFQDWIPLNADNQAQIYLYEMGRHKS